MTKYKPYKKIYENGRWYQEHRKVVESFLGRKLTNTEVVHHINGNPKDNRIENLQVMDRIEHNIFESSKKKIVRIKLNCPVCTKEIYLHEKYIKWKKDKGVKNFYCSKRCSGINTQKQKIITKEQLLFYINKKLNITEIAKELNCCRVSIYKHMREYELSVKEKYKRKKEINGKFHCWGCKEWKYPSEFHKHKNRWNKLDGECKICKKKRQYPNLV